MTPDLGDDGGAERYVWYEVAVHYIDCGKCGQSYCLEIQLKWHEPCSQSAPFLIVFEQSAPKAAKSAERIEGAMMAGGDMVGSYVVRST